MFIRKTGTPWHIHTTEITHSNNELLTHATTWINDMILYWAKGCIVSAWFHSCEVEDEAKLIYSDQSQNTGFSQGVRSFLTGSGHKRISWGGRMYCTLNWFGWWWWGEKGAERAPLAKLCHYHFIPVDEASVSEDTLYSIVNLRNKFFFLIDSRR